MTTTSTNDYRLVTKISSTASLELNEYQARRESNVKLSVEDVEKKYVICSKTFKNHAECQAFIEEHDTPDNCISNNLIEAIRQNTIKFIDIDNPIYTHEADYEDATDKKAWLYEEYNDEDLIDHLLDNCHDYDEIAKMMENYYSGSFDSEEDFLDSLGYEDELETFLKNSGNSFLKIYLKIDKGMLLRDLLISDYNYYEVNGNYHFFEKY